MFLTYLSIACVYFVIMGASPFLVAADIDSDVSLHHDKEVPRMLRRLSRSDIVFAPLVDFTL